MSRFVVAKSISRVRNSLVFPLPVYELKKTFVEQNSRYSNEYAERDQRWPDYSVICVSRRRNKLFQIHVQILPRKINLVKPLRIISRTYEFLHDMDIDAFAFLPPRYSRGVIHSPFYHSPYRRKFHIYLHLDSTK